MTDTTTETKLPERPPNMETGTPMSKLNFLDRLPWRRRAREKADLLARVERTEKINSALVHALTGHTETMKQHANGWLDLCARVGAVEAVFAHSGKAKAAMLQRAYQRILADLQARAAEATGQSPGDTPEHVKEAIAAHLAKEQAQQSAAVEDAPEMDGGQSRVDGEEDPVEEHGQA